MKTHSVISNTKLKNSFRSNINPIRNLTPQSLTRILDDFHHGYLAPAALAWDAIERRDDVLQGVISKRKKSVARLNWEILTVDDSPEAKEHQQALQHFYNNLTATNACDTNQTGGFSLLVKQMLDAVGKKYAVHEIVFKPQNKMLTADFRFVPLWFFENRSGELKFLKSDCATQGVPLEKDNWLVTCGDGLMESCSIAYLFKHLPLRDWLVYCERNGMPGVKGLTDATPDSLEWQIARDAVRDFGSEFFALMSRGTDIEAIDLTTKGDLPYPIIVERMDRAMIALWRGSDLSTMSKQATGASVQADESELLLQDDAAMVSETLNSQIDRVVLRHLFGVNRGKAYIKIQPNQNFELYRQLWEMGMPLPINHIRERFAIPAPIADEPTLTSKK